MATNSKITNPAARNPTGNLIPIDYVNGENRDDGYRCPNCREKLIPKCIGNGFEKRPYFAHRPNSSCKRRNRTTIRRDVSETTSNSVRQGVRIVVNGQTIDSDNIRLAARGLGLGVPEEFESFLLKRFKDLIEEHREQLEKLLPFIGIAAAVTVVALMLFHRNNTR